MLIQRILIGFEKFTLELMINTTLYNSILRHYRKLSELQIIAPKNGQGTFNILHYFKKFLLPCKYLYIDQQHYLNISKNLDLN